MPRPITPSMLILGPRPGKKSFERIEALELTHCVTLLGLRETPQAIEAFCGRIGVDWLWLPIKGGHVDILRETDLAAHIRKLHDAIADTPRPRVYLHCSAGIHRTGIFAYLLLRLGGLEPDAARAALADLREVTAGDVGDHRLEFCEELLSSGALDPLKS